MPAPAGRSPHAGSSWPQRLATPARRVIRESPRAAPRQTRSPGRCARSLYAGATALRMHGGGGFVARLWGCLLLVGLAGLSAPASAAAHLKSGTLSTDFEARGGTVRPAAPGIAARVLDGDQRLELRVEPGRVVVVLGLLGEPFLRFSQAGVEANAASPTASSARVISASAAVSSPGVRWRRVSRGTAFAWHEGRLRPVQVVRDSTSRPRVVAALVDPADRGRPPRRAHGHRVVRGRPVVVAVAAARGSS